MADLVELMQHGLLDWLGPSREAMRALDYQAAQHVLLETGDSNIKVSVAESVSHSEALSRLTATDDDQATRWTEIRAIFEFYDFAVTLPAGTYSISSLVKLSTAASRPGDRRRQVTFELVALARKDRGNRLFKGAKFDDALHEYTRAFAVLGVMPLVDRQAADPLAEDFPATPGRKPRQVFQQSPCKHPEGSLPVCVQPRSPDLFVSLCNNRSLCHLKLGCTLAAIDDAQKALNRMANQTGEANLQTLIKSKYRLASALVRAGHFREAASILDEIDNFKTASARACTSEMRKLINILRESCSPSTCGHSTFLEHLKAQRASLSAELMNYRGEEGWFFIRETFCECPLLLLLDMPELRKSMRKLPGKMLNLIGMVKRAQDPLNPYGHDAGDINVHKLRNMIDSSYSQAANQLEQQQRMRELRDKFGDSVFAFTDELDLEEHPENEEVHQCLILLMRWILAYLELDAFQWDAARETIYRIIFHLTVHPHAPKYFPDHINKYKSPERQDFQNPYLGNQELDILAFPKWYLCEAMYLLALCEFGRGDWKSCNVAVRSYFDLVPMSFLERNYENALYLQAWSDLKPLQLQKPGQFLSLRAERTKELKKKAEAVWKLLHEAYGEEYSAIFDAETWVEARFYHDLDFKPLPGDLQVLADNLQKRRSSTAGFGNDFIGTFEEFVGRSFGVTVRYRMSPQDKAREARKGQNPSASGAFSANHPFGFSMPDMENDLYEMQQNMFASALGGSGLAGFLGQEQHDSSSEEEEEEEEEEEGEEEEEDYAEFDEELENSM